MFYIKSRWTLACLDLSTRRRNIFSFRVHIYVCMYDVCRFIILFCKDICTYKVGMKEEIHILKMYTGNGSLSPRRYTLATYIYNIYMHAHKIQWIYYIVWKDEFTKLLSTRKICIRKYCKQRNFSDMPGAIRIAQNMYGLIYVVFFYVYVKRKKEKHRPIHCSNAHIRTLRKLFWTNTYVPESLDRIRKRWKTFQTPVYEHIYINQK